MVLNLRDYQLRAKAAAFEEWKTVTSTLIVAPTGCGKTVMAASIIERFQPMRCLFLAHRGELLFQAKKTIELGLGLQCQMEKAELKINDDLFGKSPVVLAMVQTLNTKMKNGFKRMSKLNPMEFGLVVADEAHHSCADQFKNVINYMRQNPDLRVLGITGTPDRADEEALGQIFETVAFDYEIIDAINDGWLVPIEQLMVTIDGLDFSKIHTTAGDLNGAELAQVMEAEKNLQGVAAATLDIVKDTKRTIVFTVSVKQSEILSDIFNRHRAGSSNWVCGKTPEEKRSQMLRQFSEGEIQIMVNCGVLSEGYDNPAVEVIVQARPTKSRALYTQQVGRSTRPLPGLVDGLPDAETRRAAISSSTKPNCLIIDFAGNSGRHKLMTAADILGGKVSDNALEKAIARMKRLGKPVRVIELLEEEEEKLKKSIEEARQREAARKAKLVAQVQYRSQYISPFDILELQPERQRGWHDGKVLSEKQQSILRKQGIDPTSLPFAQGRQLVIEVINRWQHKLASFKQVALLKKFGIDGKDFSYTRASKTIDALKNNHWKALAPEQVPSE